MTNCRLMSLNMLTDGLYNFGDSRFKIRIKALRQMLRETEPDLIGTQELTERMKPYLEKDLEMQWARPVQNEKGEWEFNVMTQRQNDPLTWFKEGRFDEILNNALANMDVFMLHTHAGYLDRELLELSSYNMLRPMEAGFLMSEELRNWVKANNVELVNILDVFG